MSIFSELLPKINEISNAFVKNFNDDLKVAFDSLHKFEEEFQNGRSRAREKTQKDNAMTTLQSIDEDEGKGEPNKQAEPGNKHTSSSKSSSESRSSNESAERRASKKRCKNEVEGMSSPEQDKRQKRNASVKAQSIISKQVNVNLTQKLRRQNSVDMSDKNQSAQSTRGRRKKDDDKENVELNSVPVVQIKLEKVSLLVEPEPMDMESLPVNIEVKQELNKDEIAMPPPQAPKPKPRKAAPKGKPQVEETSELEPSALRRTTRTRKQTDTTLQPVPTARATRSSSRAQPEAGEPPEAEGRPKRTRGRKKVSETPAEPEIVSQSSQESLPASPAEKPRPKRTRKVQKATEKEPKPVDPKPTQISPKEERISQPETTSPILPQKELKPKNKKEKTNPDLELTKTEKDVVDNTKLTKTMSSDKNEGDKVILDETRVIVKAGEMDQTVVLPNGLYIHAPVTPKNVCNVNETVVLEAGSRETFILEKPQNIIMDATVVIDKGPNVPNIGADNSLITDDSDDQDDAYTPPKKGIAQTQPTSAVKEKVQQFEEMASRVTRTKTRAMAKKEDEPNEETPPDKISKAVLSSETLSKMNSLIFNGKPLQVSSSATKPRANIVTTTKSFIPASTSKLSALNKAKEIAEETLNREDARKKKEAMLEARKEMHKRKREEKMAAASAARLAAERERAAALEAAARDRRHKQAHADLGRVERVRDAERKKQELARKVAETEERRRAEEAARQQRLADDQRRALAQRHKQLEEQEAMKREAAKMAKEIEQKQREYIEKQKKQRLEDKSHTPFKTPAAARAVAPVCMEDGFQYLLSDSDEEPPPRPVPEWWRSKVRRQQLLALQARAGAHVQRLFRVRRHSPDLRDIFPDIERARLKRTSSAVWRTPDRLPPLRE